MQMIISLIITLGLIYLVYYLINDGKYSENFMNDNGLNKINDYCGKNDTHAVEMTNIPFDSQTSHKIGGEYTSRLKSDEPLTSQNGKYVFPIVKWLYDGIWDNKDIINGTTGIREWRLTNKGEYVSNGKYTTDNYFHVPIKTVIPFDDEICDTSVEPVNVRILFDTQNCLESEIKYLC